MSHEFRRLVAQTDLPKISLHGLRHGYAAALVASGAHVRAIVERLGHSSASFSLDRHAHLIPSLGVEAASAVEVLVDDPVRNGAAPGLSAQPVMRGEPATGDADCGSSGTIVTSSAG